jgi:hypothetical protein
MAKTPDKWERKANSFFKNEGPFYVCEVAQLLRAQHRAVVRMMRKDIDTYKDIIAKTDVVANAHVNALARWVAVQKILDRLNKVAK